MNSETTPVEGAKVATEAIPVATGRAWPRVAIVVLNWNGWNDTIECLEALQHSDYPDYRVIVVDNGSTDVSIARIHQWASGELPVASALVPYDATPKPAHCVEYTPAQAEAGGLEPQEAELAALPSARGLVLIEIPANLGFAAGNNVALTYALALGFPYVLLLNNDVVIERDTLRTLVLCLEEHSDWAAVAPKVLKRADPSRILYAGGALRLWQARAIHLGRSARDGPTWVGARTTGHVSACCALYRGDFLRDAGLLDEDFFFGQEDVALSCIARKHRWLLGVQLDARVIHNEGHSLEGRPAASAYYYAKYRVLLLTKYGSRLNVLTGLLFLALSRLVKFPLAILRGWADLVKAEIRGYRDYFAGKLADYDRQRANARR
jgi:GT2 family glycosyltransferase